MDPTALPPLRVPAPLVPGSRIAVTAPSAGVEPACHARLDLALAHLRAQGFEVVEGLCLRRQTRGASAPAGQRAAEWMYFLQQDDVAAVLPPWGGELALELLDRLDWAQLASSTPKWVLGYSDLSTLLLPLTLRLGWATAHGPCLMDLVPAQQDALTRGVLPALALPAGARVEQRSSAHWQRHRGDFAADPGVAFAVTEPTRPWCLQELAEVTLRGRLIGGCIDTLAHTAGTVHGDIAAFAARQRAGGDGTLLYLENAELTPTALVRALHRLRWAGWFDAVDGVLVGRDGGPGAAGDDDLPFAEALQSVLGELPCPVLADLDIGHRPPQWLLVNGARAELTWRAGEPARLVQTLD